MSMNREQKRLLQRQGEVDADGEPIRQRREQSSHQAEERTSVAQFSREVRAELRKVAWPSRAETANYATVVVVTIIAVTAIVAGLDWVFSNSVLNLFDI
ncbi:MAG TPA: preprotein translocase subunit SecE [Acidimicrobiales bacterium]|jgi:preprotein translocase subunit SecE|nr:preprotein translocase subunit SecE [Acidimicrobiales bacterium]MDP6281909.1 preprotein translocase subunit SecE [Acidimicrobiales bacterium]MDP7116722.1 preprotein translocase subunit SecE [Acidimicrobiales bacterium]MDP7410701.1 preprotein translocase subunit SecE [Acidimicrobiales bacterium]MEE1522813.1 preprotein translocase subunit SecE [Acidimicrobiales bacterium]|tara:strand:+ start:359 stop:655 length:297 start_codon:yes stop_codon:yes gene_type:complete